jgi:MFS family permease
VEEISADGIFGLPRALWFVAGGIFVNYLGYGAVLPFEVIYLHDGLGFSVGLAGLIISLISGVAVLSAAPAGPLIDRFGARAVAAAGAVALALGYAGLGYAGLTAARSPAVAVVAVAVAAAVIAGVGNGALNPSQSTLVATLCPPHLRHRATAVSRVAGNVGVGLGGGVGGLVAAHGMAGFIALLLANAASYVAFLGILLAVVRTEQRPPPMAGGYRLVLRDRAFVRLAVANVALIAVGWGAFTWLVPPYAGNHLGVSPPLIGLLLLANAAAVAVFQIPVARLAEGHRRATTMGLAGVAFAVSCVLMIVGYYPALVVASMLVGIGECLHTTVLMPLTADLAPAALRGRYMAAMGLSWWIGLALAPAAGAPFLNSHAPAVFLAGAGLCVVALALVLRMDRMLPVSARVTASAS